MKRVLLLALAVAGCVSGRDVPPPQLRGTSLVHAVPKPALTLTATDGRPFDLRARTAGTVTLLFFGYTH